MQTILQPCKTFSFLDISPPLCAFPSLQTTTRFTAFSCALKCPARRTPTCCLFSSSGAPKGLFFSRNSWLWRSTQLVLCSQNDTFDGFPGSQLPKNLETDIIQEEEELELLDKPSPITVSNGYAYEVDNEAEKPDKDEALAPFLKFFKPRDSLEETEDEESKSAVVEKENDEAKMVNIEYYEPNPGDFVVGVVVSGNENKLDVNVGADLLGTMLTKEVLPLYVKEMDYLLCDMENDAEEFLIRGKMGIVKDDDALNGGPVLGRPVVEIGTVLFAEVLGRTLSGRPLLSTRRLFRKIAWHRVRQIKQLNEPIEVKFTEWNTGGLLTRIEGLRAFLPKAELMKRVNNFAELKEYVGHRMYVQITRINESTNDLILSERDAWEMLHLRDGTLVEGTVKKILPYGAQIRIGETNRSGLLHISNVSQNRISSVADLLKEGEKVKVLVVKSLFPEKISLSIADLESEPGLFLSNKERVFSEAEEMAKKYREKIPFVSSPRNVEPPPTSALPLDNEESLYANWKWFKFESTE